MKSSERYDAELKAATARRDKAYALLLRSAAKCKQLDRTIRRLKKARNKTRVIEKRAAHAATLSTLNGDR